MLVPVSKLVMVTATPGTTAPEESDTVPLISPVFAFWPRAMPAVKLAASRRQNRLKGRTVLNLIAEPPKIDPCSESTPQIVSDRGREYFPARSA
jgi:anthranilate phosphoribosyltransferase